MKFRVRHADEPQKAERFQWWLAELDGYGNPTLIDGMHSDRDGCLKAVKTYHELEGVISRPLTRPAIVRLEVEELVPE